MPTVPTYQDTQQPVALRPEFNQNLTGNASPDAFGASIGRGMEGLANGVDNVGDAITKVRELDDVNSAKDADNNYANWARDAMYGDNGYMTLDGKNAIDARDTFEKNAAQKREEFGQGLTPGAAQHYQDASRARLGGLLQQSVVHSSQERKTWFNQTSTARVDGFSNDALVNYSNPALVNKNIAAAVNELTQQSNMQGVDAATLDQRKRDLISGVHKNVTLRMAQDDPIAAENYMKANADNLTGSDQYDLNNSLKTELKNAHSKSYAADIMSGGRNLSDQPGDMVADVVNAASPKGSIGAAGPTNARSFLISKLTAGHSAESINGLDSSFATNIAALIQDAPPEIRQGLQIASGYRSPEEQTALFNKSDKSGHMVAFPPGYQKPDGTIAKGSNHNFGRATDLGWNGQLMKPGVAPQAAIDYVHQNAAKYGLNFRMGWEPWHIEPTSGVSSQRPTGNPTGTVSANSDAVASRATQPSYDDIEKKLADIPDEDTRDLTRRRIYAQIEAQSKAQEADVKQAKSQLWSYIDQGKTPDQVPMDVRQTAGMDAVSSAWNYMATARNGRDVQSDDTLLYSMKRAAAANPEEFANIDLNNYRDRLSKKDIADLTSSQSSALTDMRKTKDEGLDLTSAWSQARTQLDAAGITKEPSKMTDDDNKRLAQFNNTLADQMDEFKKANPTKKPTQTDVQQMINRLLLPIIIKQPGTVYGTNDTNAFMFQAGTRPDNSTVEGGFKYADIPIDLRRGVSVSLERDLGRKPTQVEIEARYNLYRMSQIISPDATLGNK